MLGQEWDEVLREAMALFGPDYPLNSTDRERVLGSIAADDALAELDRRYFDLEVNTNADSLTCAYLGVAD